MNKIERQNKHFDAISSKYYSARQNKRHLLYKHLLFRHVLCLLEEEPDKQIAVLEPMCGYGEGKKIIQKYVSKNIIYEGFDYCDALIDKIRKKSPHTNIFKQDVTTFIPDKTYDVIILIGGLHHVPDYAEAVCKNLSKGLKKGGLFINFEPTNNNFAIKIIRDLIYKKNQLFDDKTERAFSLNELNGFYAAAGLHIEKQYYPGLIAYVLWYNPDAFPALNIGNEKIVNRIFNIEKKAYSNKIGRILSFCTFTILRK